MDSASEKIWGFDATDAGLGGCCQDFCLRSAKRRGFSKLAGLSDQKECLTGSNPFWVPSAKGTSNFLSNLNITHYCRVPISTIYFSPFLNAKFILRASISLIWTKLTFLTFLFGGLVLMQLKRNQHNRWSQSSRTQEK
jgi:hypothetical protein